MADFKIKNRHTHVTVWVDFDGGGVVEMVSTRNPQETVQLKADRAAIEYSEGQLSRITLSAVIRMNQLVAAQRVWYVDDLDELPQWVKDLIAHVESTTEEVRR